ncbi:hypothetical protein [Actinokineospora sp. NPDC004072]
MSEQQAKKLSKPVAWLIVVGTCVAVIVAVIAGAASSDDNDLTVSVPTGQETADLVQKLAEAEEAHGICYGWVLTDADKPSDEEVVSSGSSRGAGTSAEECQRYVWVDARVDYESESSSFEDSASIIVHASPGLPEPSAVDLERLGVTQEALLAEPAAAVGYGALALPLLMAEDGVVEPLPTTPAAAAPATPIGRPGSDFVGNHTGGLIALGVVGGLALLCLIVGLTIRIRGREAR